MALLALAAGEFLDARAPGRFTGGVAQPHGVKGRVPTAAPTCADKLERILSASCPNFLTREPCTGCKSIDQALC